MGLEPGERILIESGNLGYHKRVILTDKRLIFEEGKGFFKVTWVKESEIFIDEIEETYIEMDSFTALETLKIKKKNGEFIDLQFKLSDSQMLGAGIESDALAGMSIRQHSINERWINAINRQLSKLG